MKNIVKIIFVMSFMSFLFISCNHSPKAKEDELESAKEDLIDAEDALQESKIDSVNDYNTFKNSIELKLKENQKLIEKQKAIVNSSKDSEKAKNLKELTSLEGKNNKLNTRLQDYDQQGTSEKWELFKVEFNKEMDDLGKSISKMAENNMKK